MKTQQIIIQTEPYGLRNIATIHKRDSTWYYEGIKLHNTHKTVTVAGLGAPDYEIWKGEDRDFDILVPIIAAEIINYKMRSQNEN